MSVAGFHVFKTCVSQHDGLADSFVLTIQKPSALLGGLGGMGSG